MKKLRRLHKLTNLEKMTDLPQSPKKKSTTRKSPVNSDGWFRIAEKKPSETYIIAYDGKNLGEAYKNEQGGYSWAIYYTKKEDPCIKITHWRFLPNAPGTSIERLIMPGCVI